MHSDVTASDRLRWMKRCIVSDVRSVFTLRRIQLQACP